MTDLPAPDLDAIVQAADLIARADGLLVAAGAGIGVDSGLPDFRGDSGFWNAYPALRASGTGFSAIASPAAFEADPRRAWGFYGHRLALYRRTTPHAGFGLLRAWGQRLAHGSFVFTSNVDGQFQAAGFDPLRIDECHGSIHTLQCTLPCSEATWPAAALAVAPVDPARCEWQGPLPCCPRCGALARPNILMFNDSAWIEAVRERQALRFHAWIERLRRPLVIELGAGMRIPTVRRVGQRVALRPGGSLVRINPRDAAIGALPGVAIESGALAALRAIDASLQAN